MTIIIFYFYFYFYFSIFICFSIFDFRPRSSCEGSKSFLFCLPLNWEQIVVPGVVGRGRRRIFRRSFCFERPENTKTEFGRSYKGDENRVLGSQAMMTIFPRRGWKLSCRKCRVRAMRAARVNRCGPRVKGVSKRPLNSICVMMKIRSWRAILKREWEEKVIRE